MRFRSIGHPGLTTAQPGDVLVYFRPRPLFFGAVVFDSYDKKKEICRVKILCVTGCDPSLAETHQAGKIVDVDYRYVVHPIPTEEDDLANVALKLYEQNCVA